jgi:hypothetical protein
VDRVRLQGHHLRPQLHGEVNGMVDAIDFTPLIITLLIGFVAWIAKDIL